MAVKALPVGFRLSRMRGSWIAGRARLAVVAFFIAPASLLQHGSHRVVSFGGLGREFANLVEAVGASRPIEARLTGGFHHGAWQDSKTAVSKPGGWQILAAAAQLRQRAGIERTPLDLKFLAASHLVLGEHDRAIALLQEAVALTPDDGTLLSDLAAAHLTRATRADRPDDLPRAITYAERALRTPSAPLEASFNVALALEQLPLRTQAVVAWGAYLARNDRSPWRDEGLTRLAALERADHARVLEADRLALSAAAKSHDLPAVTALGQRSPSMGRELYEEELLPRWAVAVTGGDAAADLHLSTMVALGKAIQQGGGDALSAETSRFIAARNNSAKTTLASAALLYDRARQLNDADRFSDAGPLYREAAGRLRALGCPFWLRAQLQYSATRIYAQDKNEAVAVATVAQREASGKGFGSVTGRAHWLLGLLLDRPSQLVQRLDHYEQALTTFEQSRESAYAAFIRMMLAETFGNYGDEPTAWRYRRQALLALDQMRDPRRRHATLTETALACAIEGLTEAASHVNRAIVDHARAWGRATALNEGFMAVARVEAELGNIVEARSFAEQSRKAWREIEDAGSRARVEPFLFATSAVTEAEHDPEAARASARSAIDGLRALGAFAYMAPLWRLSARTLVAQGQLDTAERLLGEGIAELEGDRSALGEPLQISHTDASWDLFRDLIELQATRLGRQADAFATAERGRSMTLRRSLGHESGLSLSGAQQRLPAHVALLSLTVLQDRVLGWALRSDRHVFRDIALPRNRLNHLVATLRSLLEDRAATTDIQRVGRTLDAALLQPFEEIFRDATVLMIVPDDVLHDLPFAALVQPHTGQYLAVRTAPLVVPSATVGLESLRTKRFEPEASEVLVIDSTLANDEGASLPAARGESRAVTTLYPSTTHVRGTDLEPAALVDAMLTSDIVHIAGHAVGSTSPDAVRFVLGKDPVMGHEATLSASDLAGRHFTRTRLVVLAACETARGTISRGEGVLSLARPFLSSGVPFVVATLWQVEDAGSAALIVEFHREYQRDGDAAQALGRAQRALLARGDDSSHPSSWAGFTTVGGGKNQQP